MGEVADMVLNLLNASNASSKVVRVLPNDPNKWLRKRKLALFVWKYHVFSFENELTTDLDLNRHCNPTQDLGYAALLWPTGGTGPVWVTVPIRIELEDQRTIFNCGQWLGGTDMDNLETATLSITTMKGGVEETHTLTIMHATQEVSTKHPVNSSILVLNMSWNYWGIHRLRHIHTQTHCLRRVQINTWRVPRSPGPPIVDISVPRHTAWEAQRCPPPTYMRTALRTDDDTAGPAPIAYAALSAERPAPPSELYRAGNTPSHLVEYYRAHYLVRMHRQRIRGPPVGLRSPEQNVPHPAAKCARIKPAVLSLLPIPPSPTSSGNTRYDCNDVGGEEQGWWWYGRKNGFADITIIWLVASELNADSVASRLISPDWRVFPESVATHRNSTIRVRRAVPRPLPQVNMLVHVSWDRRRWMEGDGGSGGSGGGGDLHPSWCTFHGTAGSGWRVMEAAEAAEVEETSIPAYQIVGTHFMEPQAVDGG
ncbi:hypothetical protein B0H17DRAFT_1138371 [Mycena rosella]|uniref:Uncharacterized protein n=1 Tax=Mycena rosella TaxID=1033263 RepID=A0AAD7D6C4_MYCRO|nr:hypothetical protein B0H17DRAFT_1138371 [Mycena rosella]